MIVALVKIIIFIISEASQQQTNIFWEFLGLNDFTCVQNDADDHPVQLVLLDSLTFQPTKNIALYLVFCIDNF